MSEDASAEGGREGEDNEPDAETSEGSEWIRIDDLADRPKKIVIFHRQTNPNYYHQNEYLPAVKEMFKKLTYAEVLVIVGSSHSTLSECPTYAFLTF